MSIRDPNYIVMDGRAIADFDRACVLGVYSAKDDEEALKLFNADWTGYDAVMFKKVGNNWEVMFTNDGITFPKG